MSTVSQNQASIEQIWAWLEEVPDPEIPVISLVDLGIIRKVEWNEDVLEVTITPTYSGCPATTVINLEVENALRQHGIENVKLHKQISPPWTTDWLSEEGSKKLKEYGIAGPIAGTKVDGSSPISAPNVACPRCDSENTSVVSFFGSTPCKAHYRCNDCLEPFDYFKCI